MNEIKVLINFEKRTNVITGVDLTSGDYNSTKIIFDFDRDDGTKIFELKNPKNEVVFSKEIINNEIILANIDENGVFSSIFNMAGEYTFEVSLYASEGKLTSDYNYLNVEQEQVVIDDTIVEPYLPIFDELMQKINTAIVETNNLNISAEKVEGITTLTITKKDGSTQEVEIYDGEAGEGGGSSKNSNIENGTGEKSLQQTLDSASWDTKNEAVKYYITEEIGTEDDPNRKIAHNGDTIIVGTYGKSSFMQNGKGQTIGGKSHAEGSKCIAFENNAHAEGNETFAAGKQSHAEGNNTSALGNASHAEGLQTTAFGVASHSEGIRSSAIGDYSHAEGVDAIAENQYCHAEGCHTTASGDTSHAEGNWATASGTYSHAEGSHTNAENDCAHAEGYMTFAKGVYSHSEGSDTHANGKFAHAEGNNTVAEGIGSHAEGVGTQANKDCTHTEGYQTKANAVYSHAEGYGTVADRPYSHVQGVYNVLDTNKQYLHIIGNGTSETKRSNAHTVDWDGNAMYAGNIKIRGTEEVISAKDYATYSKAGLVRPTNGLTITGTNKDAIGIAKATNAQIDGRTDSYSPIVSSNLDYAVRSVKPEANNIASTTLSVNTIYDLGIQSDLALNLPAGVIGDFIQVDFLCDVATNLTITSSSGLSELDLVPEAGMIYSLFFDWGRLDETTYGWRISYAEYIRAEV